MPEEVDIDVRLDNPRGMKRALEVEVRDRPPRRAGFVVPEKKKRKYKDGTPKHPARSLLSVIEKVRTQRYSYTELAPGEDIRVLILEPGQPGDPATGTDPDPVRCRLVPSALPSTKAVAQVPAVIPYEALSYYWGLEQPSIPILILSYSKGNGRHSITNVSQKKFWIRPNLFAALVQLRDLKDEVSSPS